MARLPQLLAKSGLIALLAACAAWLPWAGLNGFTMTEIWLGLQVALLGTFIVGLPIALLTYFLARKQLAASPTTVFLVANFAGAVMLIVTVLLGDVFGGIFVGIPSWIAANTFAVLGYFWIIRPERETIYAGG